MDVHDRLKSKSSPLCVVGLGYVGLPLAVLFSKHFDVTGFDVSERRVEELKSGSDRTREVGDVVLADADIAYTTNPEDIGTAACIVVAVPTPIDDANEPDVSLIESASETVGMHMSAGCLVVFESTVYPGLTEELCIPALEKASGMTAGKDFFVGYSPERVNPGDKEHTIDKVVKVVSGMDEKTTIELEKVYGAITKTFSAASIKAAEAAKVIENTQRDLNVALMNEFTKIFHKMGISTHDVLDAAGTKWNFMPFTPGLVGGHCIGVDPYYLTHKAKEVGYDPEVILSGRKTNDTMHEFVANSIFAKAKELGMDPESARVTIFGLTFKENIPDVRNSKVVDLFHSLKQHGFSPAVHDPHADKQEVKDRYTIDLLTNLDDVPKTDIAIFAVAHSTYKDLSVDQLRDLMNHDTLLIADMKRMFDASDIESDRATYWTL